MTKTAIIVDDEQSGRDYLERLLGFCENVKVIAKTGIPEKALELITEKKPDILFLDVEMPRMSGFEVLKTTRNQGLNPTVIFTTGYSQYAIKCIKEQVFDYLLKPIIFDELKQTLKRLDSCVNKSKLNPKIAGLLSKRETEILNMITEGKTSKEIGMELFISKTTVDTHRRNILEKTGARKIVELLIYN